MMTTLKNSTEIKKIDKLGSKSTYKNKENDQISLEKLFTPKMIIYLACLKMMKNFYKNLKFKTNFKSELS